MSATAHVARVKRALVIFRRVSEASVIGAGVALDVEGRAIVGTDASVAAAISRGEARSLDGDASEVLARDDEQHVAVLALRAGSLLDPLSLLVTAPLQDAEELLVIGPGVTLRTGAHARHAWITHSSLVAGRLHDVADGERLETFVYALALPPGALPPGSPVLRREDGALVALLGAESPSPGLVLARPLRELISLTQGLRRPAP
jgi:hypothetical protein